MTACARPHHTPVTNFSTPVQTRLWESSQPPSADLRVWLAGLLIILSTVLSLADPSGSLLDFYYKWMRISAVRFLYPYAICTVPDKWPTGTFDLLPISITPLPFLFSPLLHIRCSERSIVFSFHKPVTFQNRTLIPAGKWTRFQECW